MSKVDKELLSDLGLSDAEEEEDEDQVSQDEGSEEGEEDEGSEEGSEGEENENDDDGEDDEELNDEGEQESNEEGGEEKIKLSKKLNEKEKAKMLKKVEEFNLKQKQKGVCYLSRIPPYMKASYVRKLLESYGVGRIYLAAEDEKKRKFRAKNGGNRKRCYTEGWVEFFDKRIAKRVALSLNCTKMVRKTRSFYGEDLWNIKYLPKFKWENLTERIAYQNRVRKEKLAQELQVSKKEQEFYRNQLDKSKKIQAVEKRRSDKSQPKAENIARRTFLQRAPTKKFHNAQSDREDSEQGEE